MMIDLTTITNTPRRMAFVYEPEWWRSEPGDEARILGLEGPLSVTVNAYRSGERIVLEGALSGRLRIRCDRCLKPLVRRLETEFRVFFSPPPPQGFGEELALQSEDLEGDFVTGEELHVDDVVREQIYLSLPMKSLCRENCPGLCPRCGADLNQGRCRCPGKTGHPAFAKLEQMKKT